MTMTEKEIGRLTIRKKELEGEIAARKEKIQEMGADIEDVSRMLPFEHNCSMQDNNVLVFYKEDNRTPIRSVTFPTPEEIVNALSGLKKAEKELEEVESKLDKV